MSDSFETPWAAACSAPLSLGILQARILEWVAMPSSRGTSRPRDWTQVSHTAGRFFTIWATREAPCTAYWNKKYRNIVKQLWQPWNSGLRLSLLQLSPQDFIRFLLSPATSPAPPHENLSDLFPLLPGYRPESNLTSTLSSPLTIWEGCFFLLLDVTTRPSRTLSPCLPLPHTPAPYSAPFPRNAQCPIHLH